MTDDLTARIARLEDRAAIADLTARYALHVAAGECEQLAGLFTEDGVFESGERRVEGRAAMVAMLEKSFAESKPVPIVGQLSITLDSPERARLKCLMASTFERGEPGGFCGHYNDELVKVNGEWQFAIRRFAHYFKA